MSTPLLFALASSVLFMLGIVIGACGTQNGVYLCRTSQQERVFRKPLVQRIGTAVMSFGVLLAPVAFAQSGGRAFALSLLLCLPVAGVLLRLSGPSELRLNLQDHTYYRVKGWPFLSSAQSGSLADLGGVYVSVTSSGYGIVRYSVGIRGKRFGVMYLGRFELKAAAEQFAKEFMSELSLPPALSP